jgi:hypothetical protein
MMTQLLDVWMDLQRGPFRNLLFMAFALGSVFSLLWKYRNLQKGKRPIPLDERHLRALVRNGETMQAINLWRKAHGGTQDEARRAIDALRHQPPDLRAPDLPPPHDNPGDPPPTRA